MSAALRVHQLVQPRSAAAHLAAEPAFTVRSCDDDEALFAAVEAEVETACALGDGGRLDEAVARLQRALLQLAGGDSRSPGQRQGAAATVAGALLRLQLCVLYSSKQDQHAVALEEALTAGRCLDEVWSKLCAAVAGGAPPGPVGAGSGGGGATAAAEEAAAWQGILQREPPKWIERAVAASVQARHCIAVELEYYHAAAAADGEDLEALQDIVRARPPRAAAAVAGPPWPLISALHEEGAKMASWLPAGHPTKEMSALVCEQAMNRKLGDCGGASDMQADLDVTAVIQHSASQVTEPFALDFLLGQRAVDLLGEELQAALALFRNSQVHCPRPGQIVLANSGSQRPERPKPRCPWQEASPSCSSKARRSCSSGGCQSRSRSSSLTQTHPRRLRTPARSEDYIAPREASATLTEPVSWAELWELVEQQGQPGQQEQLGAAGPFLHHDARPKRPESRGGSAKKATVPTPPVTEEEPSFSRAVSAGRTSTKTSKSSPTLHRGPEQPKDLYAAWMQANDPYDRVKLRERQLNSESGLRDIVGTLRLESFNLVKHELPRRSPSDIFDLSLHHSSYARAMHGKKKTGEQTPADQLPQTSGLVELRDPPSSPLRPLTPLSGASVSRRRTTRGDVGSEFTNQPSDGDPPAGSLKKGGKAQAGRPLSATSSLRQQAKVLNESYLKTGRVLGFIKPEQISRRKSRDPSRAPSCFSPGWS
eukprot:TRINITY_DN24883_c0_g2_i1.p1 TRINITY_DN24883_c0_g2~~TRINITY_DN24883_c0_g2_i1.p1  ORF type:complete len:710 (+),score=152.63 TRINITY_DN24883_c0_g2_i1:109-2238(+)